MNSQFAQRKFWNPRIGSSCEARIFALAEAENLLPVIRKVTSQAVCEFNHVRLCYRKLFDYDQRKLPLALKYEKIVYLWIAKMGGFSLMARGVWAVNYDTGDSYLSGRYPQLRLPFFVGSENPILTRRDLSDVHDEHSPSWA
jgi:hypothetical protein